MFSLLANSHRCFEAFLASGRESFETGVGLGARGAGLVPRFLRAYAIQTGGFSLGR